MDTPISIIIPARGYADALQKNIVTVLEQDYEPGYEVIVVRDSQKGETSDVVKLFMPRYSHLTSTYVPDSPKYITDVEVAVMLGTKAAKYNNIIIVAPQFSAPDKDWLKRAAESISHPLTLGQPLALAGKSWLRKASHRRKTLKIISTWLEEHGLNDKQIRLPKEQASIFDIAYLRDEYIASDDLRYFIYRYVTP